MSLGIRSSAETSQPIPPRHDLLGLPVSHVDSHAILAWMSESVFRGVQTTILHLNVHGFNLAAKLPWLKDYYNSAPLVFCDGDGIRWGLKVLGIAPPPKVTYNVFLWELARFCEQKQIRLFMIGSRPGRADRAAANLCARYPRLQIAGTHNGYFAKHGEEEEEVIKIINSARPDVLLVCFGMPAQEEWVLRNASRISAKAIFTGGAALDYAAGAVRMTPDWMVKFHIEWLFRLLMEPRRLFRRYILGNALFVATIYTEKLSRMLSKGFGRT